MTNHSTAIARRVFVSSVVDGFAEFREAARRGVLAADCEPFMVNEDFPASASSPRNACLDAIDSCDALVSIVGERGGWTAPSGKLVVEEEFEHARGRKLPVLGFLGSDPREASAVRFADRLSNYVDGVFRRTFRTPAELEHAIADALTKLPSATAVMRSPDTIRNPLVAPAWIHNDAALRLVIAPERDEELIAPPKLGSSDLREAVYAIGHSPKVGLLDYEWPKTHKIAGSELVVEQVDHHGRHDSSVRVRATIAESGLVTLETNVSGRHRRGNGADLTGSMTVTTPDMEEVLRSFFAFLSGVFDHIDPFKRQHRLIYNVGLMELGYRQIVRDVIPRSSMTMKLHGGNGPIVAFEKPRVVSRDDLSAPAAEIERTVTVLERAANQ